MDTHPPCPPDPRVLALDTPDWFAIVVLRLWSRPDEPLPPGAPQGWRAGFQAAGLDAEAMQAFAATCRLLAAASRPLDVRCLHCRAVGEDEWRWVRLLERLQAGDDAAAWRVLLGWMAPAAARLAMAPAGVLARHLRAAGLVLSAASPDLPALAGIRVTGTPDAGLRLVH
ncbi:hypothetical protein [Zavarzinia sp. CC-PAN008]|uniref:hypothetical protein n=1 Tax=Zavarzinia sp. CC-PAN008 TaxID=3243332 RepID=UPI003F746AA7